MRERITFIQKLGDSQEPSAFKINGGVISGPEIDAVREDKLTFALDDLPSELYTLLDDIHELYVRWVSPVASETVAPFLARLPPGFHLFFTPGKEGGAVLNTLCPTLSKVFGSIECSTPADSFTSLPSDRFSHSAALQYFQPLEDLSRFIQYTKDQLCSKSNSQCVARLDRLAGASSLEVSYDTISHALKITAVWPYQRQSVYAASRPQSRTEVGVLSADIPPGLEPNELGISGLLTVLEQDSEPSPVVFSFASRHQDANSEFSTSFLEPTGLHPTLQIQLESNQPPSEDASCSAHAYLTLPRNIFADKYQLADDLFLASKNLTALRYISQPVDLEAPEYVMKSWGSAILLELSPPDGEQDQSWTAEIPLHLRYLLPAKGGYESIQIPYPAVFWACTAEEGTKFPSNPFDRVNLGYDGLFGPRTVFWHVEPRPVGGNRLENTVKVPVLDLEKSLWVNAGTAIVVLAGFTWIVWKLAAVFFLAGHGEASLRETKSVKEKKQQ